MREDAERRLVHGKAADDHQAATEQTAGKQELRGRWHERIVETGRWLGRVVQGYFNYYAVPGNFAALQTFRRELARLWLAALRRRSQRHRMPWQRFAEIVNRYLPRPQILQPEPGARFDANTRGRSRMR